jgi:hypothetical protein
VPTKVLNKNATSNDASKAVGNATLLPTLRSYEAHRSRYDFSNSPTLKTLLRVLAAQSARVMRQACPSCNREGAGKAGYLLIPMARVQKKTHAAVTTGSAGYPGPPCAMVLRLIRDLPGDHAWLPPSPVGRLERLHDLDACIGAPGPRDFAVRCNVTRPRKKNAPDATASIASRFLRP